MSLLLTCLTPFTSLCPLARLASWPVAAAADCPPHGPAPGSHRADVLPLLDAIPVALPSAVREVTRYPARQPAVVDSVVSLGMAFAVAIHLAAGSVAAGSAVDHLSEPVVVDLAAAGLGTVPVAAAVLAVVAPVAVCAVIDGRVPDCNVRPAAVDQRPGYRDNRSSPSASGAWLPGAAAGFVRPAGTRHCPGCI